MFFFWKRSKPSLVTVAAEEAHQQLEANKQARIVDVREAREWAATGVAPKAVLMSLGQLAQRAPKKLAVDKPVYVICASGHRSRSGAKILLKLGYTEVYCVAGGMHAWLSAGLPVKRGK